MTRTYPTGLQTPFLLLGGMGFSAFFAGVETLAYAALVVMVPFSKTYSLERQHVSRGEFFSAMWPFFLAYPVVLASFGGVAVGLWREREWAREAMTGFWLVGAGATVIAQFVSPQPPSDFAAGLASFLFIAALAAWCLCGTAGVLAYYRAVNARQATQEPAVA